MNSTHHTSPLRISKVSFQGILIALCLFLGVSVGQELTAQTLPNCTGDLVSISLVYNGPGGVNLLVYRRSDGSQQLTTLSGVQSGDQFSVDARGSAFGTLLSTTWVEIQDPSNPCTSPNGCLQAIPSSCNSYRSGRTFGNLAVTAYTDQTGQRVNLGIAGNFNRQVSAPPTGTGNTNGPGGNLGNLTNRNVSANVGISNGSTRRNNGGGQAKNPGDLDGNGLSHNLTTDELDVNPGDGIAINSDLVEVNTSDIEGNGVYSDNNNIHVNPGDGIAVIADRVEVRAADLDGAGLSESGNDLNVNVDGTTIEIDPNNDLRIASGAAGNGLYGGSNDVLHVGDGQGIGVSGNQVQVNVDNSTIDIEPLNDELRVATGGITNNELATDAVGTGNIIDGTVAPRDLLSGGNNKVLTTDGTGNVQWSDFTTVQSAATDGDGLVIDVANSETDVNTGDGLTINADQVEVVATDIEGDGLSASSNNLNVNTGDGLTINSDNVEVVASDLDGDGLTTSGNDLAVNPGHGIGVFADQVSVNPFDLDGDGLSGDPTTFDLDVNTDNSTIEIDGSDNLRVVPEGITANEIGTGAVTSDEILDGTITTQDLGQNGASTGQVLVWNGTAWVPATNADNDSDPTNEYNTGASLSGTTLNITDGGGTVTANLSALEESADIAQVASDLAAHTTADGDLSSTNELQTLSQSGNNVTLSNGGGSISVADNDNNSSNELQSLTLSGNNLGISSGNTVSLAGFVNTDNQTLSTSASGTSRDISISNGNTITVNVADNDNNPSNELQTLSQTGNTISLSNGGGSVSVADNDNDSSNEIQTISKSGSTVTLSNGGGSFTDAVNDADASPTNELQNLSISGSTISLSGGGGAVTVPSSADNLGNHITSQTLQITTGNFLRFGVANEGSDEYHFARVNSGNNNSDLRLYIHDDATERFSIWGNSCAGGGCGNDANAIMAHYFQADGNSHLSAGSGITTIGSGGTSMRLNVQGAARISSLAGSGTRMVVTDGSGNLSAQSVPVNTDNQNLSSSSSGTNRTINISGGTGTTISVADNDNSTSNELQNLSISGSTITLSGGGGSVTVPSTADNLGNHNATTRIRPVAGNNANTGIQWADNIGGGSGDVAGIKYYVESGENTKLQIFNQNDQDDDIELFQAGAARLNVVNGNVGINRTNPGQSLDVIGNTRTTGDFIGRIQMQDTRSTNPGPNTYDREVHFEFKNRSTIGSPGTGTYGGLMTLAPWSDNSGNRHHQMFFNDGGIYYRNGQPSSGSWGGWDRVMTQSALPDNSATNEIQTLGISGSTLSLSNGGGSVTLPTTADNLGNHVATTNLNMNNREVDNVNHLDFRPGNNYGIRFWSDNQYAISMGNSTDYRYGPVTDYSIKNHMSNTAGRGWTWGVDGLTPVAAINTQGAMQIQGSFKVSNNNATGGGLILADDGGIFDRNDGYASLAFSNGIDIEDAQDNGDHLLVNFNDSYPEILGYRNGGATLVEFKTGMYNNGGTFYSQNQIYARAGIANDAGNLLLNDNVTVSTLGGGGTRMVVADNSGNLGVQNIPSGADNLGNHNATTTLDMNSNNITEVNLLQTLSNSSYDKIRVYPSSSYTIGMHSAMTFGFLNDWATTFTMNQENDRGWIWRDINDSQGDGAMSLTTNGQLYVKGNSTFTSRLGIGTTNFSYPFWVTTGNSGNWSGRFTNGNSNVYLAHQSGYGIHINTGASNSSGRYALEVRNASQTHMYVRDDGLTGFRTRAPAATVHIKQHSTNASTGGLRIEYANNSNNWQIGVSSDALLRFTRNGSSGTGVAFNSVGTWVFSDKRVKKDIKSMDPVLDRVMELRPVTYVHNADESERPSIGVVAQEVKELFPESVLYDKDIERFSVKYDDFGVLSIKAIQEMKAEYDETLEEYDQRIQNYDEQAKEMEATLSGAKELILEQQELILQMKDQMQKLENRISAQEKDRQGMLDRIYLSEQAIIELGSCCDEKNNDAGSLETGQNETLLFQNHPNPFNRVTTITYKLAEAGHTELVIYDESSMPVETVVDKVQDAGVYNIEWDGTDFTSGVYIYMLKQNDVVLAKKMVLIK